MSDHKVITRVYIDGFNLFHGLIQPNRAHWLDISAFAQRLNRGEPADKVIYCTSPVSGTPLDPDKPDRQDGYLRALAIACPNVEVVKGNFQTQQKAYPLSKCRNDPACAVRVSVRSEKGTDVNLAARLLHDAHLNRFERAIVVSGDSDLVEPIRLVTQEIGKVVWVRNPRNCHSAELHGVASTYERIRPAVALRSQLPPTVSDGVRSYSKPSRWISPAPSVSKFVVHEPECPQTDCLKKFAVFRYQ